MAKDPKVMEVPVAPVAPPAVLVAGASPTDVSSGDPIRDGKLLAERGNLRDPATDDQPSKAGMFITETPFVPAGTGSDRIMTDQTSAEMEAGRKALARNRPVVVAEVPVVPPNVLIQRQNVITEKPIGQGTPTVPTP